MSEINGADVLLRVNTGTYDTPAWTTVGSQTNVTFDQTTDPVDISSKNSRSRKLLGGRYSASVTLDALFVPSAADFAALQACMRDGSLMKIRRRYSGTDTEQADGIVASLSEAYPDQEGATVSCTLEISGDWAAV